MCTEALLQTIVLQVQDCTQEPALKIATSVYDPNLVKQTKDCWEEIAEVSNIMYLTH